MPFFANLLINSNFFFAINFEYQSNSSRTVCQYAIIKETLWNEQCNFMLKKNFGFAWHKQIKVYHYW